MPLSVCVKSVGITVGPALVFTDVFAFGGEANYGGGMLPSLVLLERRSSKTGVATAEADPC